LATNEGQTPALFAVHNQAPFGGSAREDTMTSAMAAFGIAVGGTSLICYVLMTRLQSGRRNRRSSDGSFGTDGGNFAIGDGWSNLTWLSGHNSVTDSSGNPTGSGGSDSGAGGDSGGDGGGGGD
jgi:hypothetical protein